MADRKTRAAAGPARGVVRTGAGIGEHRRMLPDPRLAPFIAHFWWVRWTVDSPTLAETLPHPSIHVVFEGARAEVAGVCTGRFSRRLEGDGWVFGIKFRPASFRQLLHAPVASLTDRVVALGAVLGDEAAALGRAVLAAPTVEDKLAVAETFFAPRLTPLAPQTEQLRDLVERVAEDRSLVRAEHLAALLDLDLRTLQRRFREHVGVSPKWVIQRYRLHEAAERLKAAAPPSLVSIAADLGYADQAHFARDFKRVVGRTPARFADDEQGRSRPGSARTRRGDRRGPA